MVIKIWLSALKFIECECFKWKFEWNKRWYGKLKLYSNRSVNWYSVCYKPVYPESKKSESLINIFVLQRSLHL